MGTVTWCLEDMNLFSHIILIPRNVVRLADISVNSVCSIFILELPNCNRDFFSIRNEKLISHWTGHYLIHLTKSTSYVPVAGNEVELVARKAGFTVVPCFTGHGIGTYFHGPPDIYHCCKCQLLSSFPFSFLKEMFSHTIQWNLIKLWLHHEWDEISVWTNGI